MGVICIITRVICKLKVQTTNHERMKPMPGWAIIKPIQKDKEGTLFITDSSKEEMQQGNIVAISPVYVKDGDSFDYTDLLKVGDKVAFKKFYDNELTHNDEKYKTIHIENIIATLDHE